MLLVKIKYSLFVHCRAYVNFHHVYICINVSHVYPRYLFGYFTYATPAFHMIFFLWFDLFVRCQTSKCHSCHRAFHEKTKSLAISWLANMRWDARLRVRENLFCTHANSMMRAICWSFANNIHLLPPPMKAWHWRHAHSLHSCGKINCDRAHCANLLFIADGEDTMEN